MKRFLEGERADARAMSPQAFRERIESEVKRQDKIAREAKFRAD